MHQGPIPKEVLQGAADNVTVLDVLPCHGPIQMIALRRGQPGSLHFFPAHPVFEDAADLPPGESQRFAHQFLLLGRNGEEGEEIVRRIFIGGEDGRPHRGVLGLDALLQTLRQDVGDDVAAVPVPEVFFRGELLCRGVGLLAEDFDGEELEAVIGHILEEGLVQMRGLVHFFLRGVCGHGNIGKGLPDLRFHRVHVEVAHDEDGLLVRPIPLVVEVQDFLPLEVLNYVQ